MALIKCNECGQVVSDKAVSCPQCGAPISGTESQVVSPISTIRVIRVGKTPLTSVTLEVNVNGQTVATYPFEVGFDKEITAHENMELTVKCQGVTTPIKLELNTQEKYTCRVYYSTSFYYELYSDSGVLLKKDKLGIGMWILCFLIPLVGIIYFFVRKTDYPAQAKSALIAGVCGFLVSFVSMLI